MKTELKSVEEVAFLRCKGFQVVSTRQENNGRRKTVFFTLETEVMSDDTFRQMRLDFMNRRSSVEPKEFAERLKDTGDLLFTELRKGRIG